MSNPSTNNFSVQAYTAEGIVNAGGARVRTEPTAENNTPIDNLALGAKVEITGKVTTEGTPAYWYQISHNGTHAYVASQYINVETAPTTTPATAPTTAPTSAPAATPAAAPAAAPTSPDDCPPSVLSVPWHTQIMSDGSGHDACGETSVKMVLGFYGKDNGDSIQTLANKLGKWGKPTGSADLIHLAGLYGQPLAVLTHDNTLTAIRTQLADHKPLILLVNYKDLGFKVHLGGGIGGDPTNQGPHWLVAIGVQEDTFYLNDPLWMTADRHGKGGACLPISAEQLTKALAGGAAANGTSSYLALS